MALGSGLTEVRNGGILLPDGTMIETHVKDQIIVDNPMERQAFARFHEVAHRYGLSVVCPRCDCAVTGQNNDTPGQKRAVSCRCREWVFVA